VAALRQPACLCGAAPRSRPLPPLAPLQALPSASWRRDGPCMHSLTMVRALRCFGRAWHALRLACPAARPLPAPPPLPQPSGSSFRRRAPPHLLVAPPAGVLLAERGASADGLDLSFATNTLGGLALAAGLLPALRAAPGARVVFVSSGGMYTGEARAAAGGAAVAWRASRLGHALAWRSTSAPLPGCRSSLGACPPPPPLPPPLTPAPQPSWSCRAGTTPARRGTACAHTP
jgi:ferric-dicitrate binding protein FerR (iron transport regulator)